MRCVHILAVPKWSRSRTHKKLATFLVAPRLVRRVGGMSEHMENRELFDLVLKYHEERTAEKDEKAARKTEKKRRQRRNASARKQAAKAAAEEADEEEPAEETAVDGQSSTGRSNDLDLQSWESDTDRDAADELYEVDAAAGETVDETVDQGLQYSGRGGGGRRGRRTVAPVPFIVEKKALDKKTICKNVK